MATPRISILAGVLSLAIAASACAAPRASHPAWHDLRPQAASEIAAPSGALVERPVVAGTRAQAAAPEQVIRDVILRGNQAQVDAIASRDQSLMAATATSRYLQELTRINRRLLDNGVVSIRLVNIDWGDVVIDPAGTTATATAYETWRTIWSDGSVDEARDRNDYRLVRDGATWRIDGDDHPEDGQRGAPPSSQPAPAPDEPRAPSPDIPRDRDSASTNWSGYAATGGTYTAVSGTWTVPQAPVGGAFGASAAWVGIGGVRTRDLIQAGTQETVSNSGRVQYRAWIETLPQASRSIPLVVEPGHSVTVSIDETAPNVWLVSLTNNTTGQNYQETIQYASCHCSAEWIQEAPSVGRRGIVPLDDFGVVSFTDGWTVRNGQAVPIAASGARSVTMIDQRGRPLAIPSAIASDGASFTVARSRDAA